MKDEKQRNSKEYLNRVMEDFLDNPSNKPDRISIGKASRLCSLSVRSIRHYCDTGLISPAFVDAETGYRYFDSGQLNMLFLIKEMRLLGFSLPEIKEALKSSTIPQMVEHFNRRIENLNTEISELEEKRRKLDYLVNNYSSAAGKLGGENPEDSRILITLKEIPCRYAAFISDPAPFVNGLIFQNAYEEIDMIIKSCRLSAREIRMAIFDNPFHEILKNVDNFEEIYSLPLDKAMKGNIDYCIEIEKPETDFSAVKPIDGGLYVSMMHRGEYFDLYKNAYPKLIEWLEAKKFGIVGKFMEIYHVTRPMASLGILPITEVQVRIEI